MTSKSLTSKAIADVEFCARKLWIDYHFPNINPSKVTATASKLPWNHATIAVRHPFLQLDEAIPVMHLPNGTCMPILATDRLRAPDGTIYPTLHTRIELLAAALRLQGEIVTGAAFFDTLTGEVVERACDPTDMDHGLSVWQKLLTLIMNGEPPARLQADPKCIDCDRLALCVKDALPVPSSPLSKAEALRIEEAPTNDPPPASSEPCSHEDTHDISSYAPVDTPAVSPPINADATKQPRTVPPREDTLPVYVDSPGAIVKLKNKEIFVWSAQGEQLLRRGLNTVSTLNLYGGVHITTPALTRLMKEDIPVCFFSAQGWYHGRTHGSSDIGVHRRIAQFRAFEGDKALEVARQLVTDKIFNQRVFLRRHNEGGAHDKALKEMQRMIDLAQRTTSMDSLRGFEGNAAKVYWAAFAAMIVSKNPDFIMDGRNRRPPRDAPNAMLSYMYGMLVRSCILAIESTGLDAHLGMYHQPHANRPSLALDLMEPFRPLIVDSAVYNLISRQGIQDENFMNQEGAVSMLKSGRTAIIRAFESRMDTEIKHPVFGYSLSYRRMLHSHAQLLAQYFEGELDVPPTYRTR